MRPLTLVLILAACTSPAEDDATPTPTATPTAAPTATPTPVPQPTPTPTPVDSTGDTGPAPTTLTPGPELLCRSPTLRQSLGPLSAPTGSGAWATQAYDPAETTLFTGGGLTVIDVDGNGLRDVLLTGVRDTRLLLQTGPLVFTDVTATHLPALADRSVAVIPADLDADGDLDLFVARYKTDDLLWRNEGDGTFVPWPGGEVVAGNADPGHSSGADFADIDADGDLDLFVTVFGAMYGDDRRGFPSRLYENRGGTFVDISHVLPDHVQTGYSFNGAFHDLDGDLLPELYIVNDHGQRVSNVLAHNRGGTFEADDGSLGLNVSLQGMGLSIDDLDNDGDVDFTMAGWHSHKMLVQNNGLWFDQHQQVGFFGNRGDGQHLAWGPVSGDLDHDGDLDFVLAFGMVHNQNTPVDQPDEVFLRLDNGLYMQVGADWGFHHAGQTRGLLAVDIDGDGWLDLLRKDLIGPATLQTTRCDDHAWLEVDLTQGGANRDAIGATVRFTAGDTTWTRWIRAGGTSIFSAGPPVAHVGLGDVDTLDVLEITWPDGEVDTFVDVPTRRRMHVQRGR